MEKGRLTVWIAAVGTLLGSLALHGKGVLDVLSAAPTALQAWTQGTAAGVLTGVGALLLAVLAWLKERVSVEQCNQRVYLSPDGLAFIVALAACVGSQLFASRTPGDLFRAVFVGSIVGLLAPWVGKFLRRVFAKKPAKPLPEPKV